ncbi:MAG: pirin-like C-terminal cupin domain-containing protein, partial [Pseudomonadota bacterium]|nr:pirin-like C-terminal cupin domain-containing protein [Pseudomonadota bacterium]
HSEMPQQEHGVMRGFQLWLNLPAAEKMKPASYRDIASTDIPIADLPNGGSIKVIANSAFVNGKIISGPIQGLTTEAIYWDVHLPEQTEFHHALPEDHKTILYVYEGDITIGEDKRKLTKGNAGLLSKGDQVSVQALSADTRFLVISGKPIKEPIVQYGPFVMNTTDEIEQAIQDYRAGTLAS